MIGEIRSTHYSESGNQKIRMQDTRNQDIRKTKKIFIPDILISRYPHLMI